MAIKQEYTKWVKKPGQKGYVIDTRTGKKVTGGIKLVSDTTKGKAGQTQMYKKGRGQAVGRKPSAMGGGQMPGGSKKVGGGSGGSGGKTPPPATDKPGKKATDLQKAKKKMGAAAGYGKGGKTPSNLMSQQTVMDKWKSMTPAQKKAATSSAAAFARRLGVNPTKYLAGRLGVPMPPQGSPRPRSPLSVKGQAEIIGGGASAIANMTASQASALLSRADKGLVKISAAQKAVLRRIIEGR